MLDSSRFSPKILNDKDFILCCKYGEFLTNFFESHGIENWRLGNIQSIVLTPKNSLCDNVNPDHYKVGGIETFDIIKAKLSPTQIAGFCKGNIIKYITRADHKGKIEDLKKAKWYLDKLIEEIESGQTSS